MGKGVFGRRKWQKGWRRIRNPKDVPGSKEVLMKSKRNRKLLKKNYEEDESLWKNFDDYWRVIRSQLDEQNQECITEYSLCNDHKFIDVKSLNEHPNDTGNGGTEMTFDKNSKQMVESLQNKQEQKSDIKMERKMY